MSMSRREIWESRTRAPLLILAGIFFVAFAIDALGSCTELAPNDVPAEYADDAQNCQERGEALALVAELSQPMNADWGAHLDFMQTKEESDPVE